MKYTLLRFCAFCFFVSVCCSTFAQTWHKHRDGIPPEYTYGGSISTVFGDGTNIYTAHLSGYADSGVFYAPTSTDTFVRAACTGSSFKVTSSFVKYAGKIFLGLSNGLHASSDNGHTWPLIPVQPCATPRVRCLYASHDTLYAGIDGLGIYRTTDSANSWVHLGNIGLDTQVHGILTMNGTIFSAGMDSLQYSTTDGASWVTVPLASGMSGAWYPDAGFATMDTTIFVAGQWGLYRSNDYGAHWTGLYGIRITALITIDSFLLIAPYPLGGSNYVRISNNRGASFTSMNTGLYINLGSGIRNFSYNDDDVMLGIWSGCSCVDSTIFTMRRFELEAVFNPAILNTNDIHILTAAYTVYPNPTSEKITIESANTIANLSIVLTDIAGHAMESFEFKGVQTVDLPVNKVASGIYLLRINDGTNITTHKLVVKR
jgi:hypothetical protein